MWTALFELALKMTERLGWAAFSLAFITLETRSTGTVHASAKARLILRIRRLDRHQNLVVCSLANC